MTYEEFVERFKAELKDHFPNREMDIREMTITKVNETYQGLTIRVDGSAKAPTFPVDEIYREYQSGIPMEILADRTAKNLQRTLDYTVDLPELNLDNAKKSIRAVVINADANRELLQNAPHEKIPGTDLAVTCRWYLDDNASFLVNDRIAADLRLTKEEVLQIGKENNAKQGYVFNDIEDVLSGVLQKEGISTDNMHEILPEEKSYLYVASTKAGVDGASIMLNGEAMKEISQRLGESYTIIPSSRHEILIVPDSQSVDGRYLKDMVRDVNEQEVDPKDRLSDNIYHYDGINQRISMCDQNGLFHDNDKTDFGTDNGRENIKIKGGIRL